MGLQAGVSRISENGVSYSESVKQGFAREEAHCLRGTVSGTCIVKKIMKNKGVQII
jgi:hypothetical protein